MRHSRGGSKIFRRVAGVSKNYDIFWLFSADKIFLALPKHIKRPRFAQIFGPPAFLKQQGVFGRFSKKFKKKFVFLSVVTPWK